MRENECLGCLFYDQCACGRGCGNYTIADEDTAQEESVAALYGEFFGNYEQYLRESVR